MAYCDTQQCVDLANQIGAKRGNPMFMILATQMQTGTVL